MKRINPYPKGLDTLQKISVSIMAVLVMLTFVGANLHALLWQQSTWLVSTVLPAVVVELTNEERAELQAPDLRRNTTLDKAAKLKAQHMAQNEYFSHFSPDGVSPWYWFDEAGYVYANAGENLAIHFTDSSEVVEAWMKSPAHRANIANTSYTEIGVGTAKGTYEGYDTVYVVQLFGTPAIPPVIPETPVEVAKATSQPVPESNDAETLAALTESANELAELIDSLAVTEDVVVTEPPEVLSENSEFIREIEIEPVTDFDVVIVEETMPEPSEEIIEQPVSVPERQDVVVVESQIATSTGLAVASISSSPTNQAGTTMVSIVTQPSELLQMIYLVLGMVVMGLLLFSAVFEARQLHFVQVTYSFGLMVSMGALWYVHSLLTSGAVIA